MTDGDSVSYRICEAARREMAKRIPGMEHHIAELRNLILEPCTGCGSCAATNRCVTGDDFNSLYDELIVSDVIFFVSPHYAPIPAKLAAFLEKAEEIAFLKWYKDPAYRSYTNL